MATEDQIADIRRGAALAFNDETYDDDLLSRMVTDLGTVEAVISAVWREKAAAYASLVDVTESGSSRALSQLRSAAADMAKQFQPVETADDTRGRSFTVGVERI